MSLRFRCLLFYVVIAVTYMPILCCVRNINRAEIKYVLGPKDVTVVDFPVRNKICAPTFERIYRFFRWRVDTEWYTSSYVAADNSTALRLFNSVRRAAGHFLGCAIRELGNRKYIIGRSTSNVLQKYVSCHLLGIGKSYWSDTVHNQIWTVRYLHRFFANRQILFAYIHSRFSQLIGVSRIFDGPLGQFVACSRCIDQGVHLLRGAFHFLQLTFHGSQLSSHNYQLIKENNPCPKSYERPCDSEHNHPMLKFLKFVGNILLLIVGVIFYSRGLFILLVWRDKVALSSVLRGSIFVVVGIICFVHEISIWLDYILQLN